MKTTVTISRLVMATVALLLLSSSATCRAPRFGDMYDCYIIVDAEVSKYGEEDYDQVDCEELMDILARGRYAHVGFLPEWRVQLYDDDGIRYRVYVSRSCRFYRIDGNYFKLSHRNAKRLQRLL